MNTMYSHFITEKRCPDFLSLPLQQQLPQQQYLTHSVTVLVQTMEGRDSCEQQSIIFVVVVLETLSIYA